MRASFVIASNASSRLTVELIRWLVRTNDSSSRARCRDASYTQEFWIACAASIASSSSSHWSHSSNASSRSESTFNTPRTSPFTLNGTAISETTPPRTLT